MDRRPSQSSRAGPPQRGCPWAQDEDAAEQQFQRGPPSGKNLRAGARDVPPAPQMGGPPASYKPKGISSAPWASDEQTPWEKPANSYGAGLVGVPQTNQHNPYGKAYADGDFDEYDESPPRAMPMQTGRLPMKPVQVAPWAVDDGEPMMSVSQAAYRGGKPLTAKPGTHNAPPMNAKEMKAKMQGAGNLLSWN